MPRLFAFFAASLALFAQSTNRIAKVENGLRPGTQIAGEPAARWTIQERMSQHKVPAVSVAVINNGRLEWAKAYGLLDATGTQSANTDTLFQAASISKPVSAIAALRLVAAGKLSLDEDVNIKLKSWKVPAHSFSKPVTLRGLLSHTAGTTVHGFPGYAAGATVPTAVQVLGGEKPVNTAKIIVDIEPGTRNRYSGGGYTIMQVLVTDVAGKPFATVVRELVIDPLSMTRSTFEQPLPETLAPNAARAHGRDGKPITGRWHTYPEQAAAGLWTTPSDLAKVLMAVQQAHAGSSKLLPPAVTQEMLKSVRDDYGLGWSLPGRTEEKAFSHGGSNAGFRCQAWAYVSKGQGAVVMTNSDSGDALVGEIMRSIADEYGWPDMKLQTRTPVKLTSDQLAAYAGTYQSQMGELTVSATDKGLRLAVPGRTFEFRPESETTFFPTTDGVPPLTFEKDVTGKITGFKGGNVKATRK